MNELIQLKSDLAELKSKMLDAIIEYSDHIEEQKKHINAIVSDAEKVELYSQIGDTMNKAKKVIKNKTPQYF